MMELHDVTIGNGPDQLSPADSYTTTKADGAVKIRMGDKDPRNRKPITLVTAFRNTVTRHGNCIALAHKVDDKWVTLSYKEYYGQTIKMAKAFIRLGLKPHHGVGIIGFNSPEWLISNMAAIFSGGLSAGIYTTNSPDACLYVANNARCNIIVAENDQQLQKFLQVREKLSDVKAIIQYKGKLKQSGEGLYEWNELMNSEDDEVTEVLRERISKLAPNKCCTLIYTSGTTGNPKGVMLSHDNITWTSTVLAGHGGCTNRDVGVSYLPLSHIAAQLMDIYCSIVVGYSIYFAQPDALKGSLKNTLGEVRPTLFLGVPRVWEKMEDAMVAVGKQNGFLKKSIASWARKVGIKAAYATMQGDSKGCFFSIADKLVYQKVRLALGLDRCRLVLTGAAPIMKETLEFFFSLNIPLLEAYGMSECTAIHTVSLEDLFYIGGVGKPYPGLETKLDGDYDQDCGEICLKGRHVFMGYLNMEEKTKEALDDEGWCHTGDVGKFNDQGYLFITGRIKELIITSGGENIPPVPVEDKVRECLPCVSNCMLVGDKKKFLSLLVTMKCEINLETMEPTDKLAAPALDWCKSVGSDAKFVSDLASNKDVKVNKAIQDVIIKVNAHATSRAQNIQKWAILPKDFSIPGGELGPTLKLKRPYVAHVYADMIDKFYAEGSD